MLVIIVTNRPDYLIPNFYQLYKIKKKIKKKVEFALFFTAALQGYQEKNAVLTDCHL